MTDRLKLQEDKKNGVVDSTKEKESPEDIGKSKAAIAFTDKSTENKDSDKPKTFEELEKETRESSLKSLNEYYSFVEDLDRNDWFSVYINAIASRFDPYSIIFRLMKRNDLM